ncbi:MAG: LysR family transcriptional regulator for bpeEF and oprC [Gammaproteobacteria bacterium]|jgi:LysR family transcriptional regulator for bpeEF and oprC
MLSNDHLISFTSAARHGSFAKAARELGHSPSAVAKNVARLESYLRVRLFHRTTRQITLSTEGERLFIHARRILEEIELLELEAAGTLASPSGTLRIDTPVTYGRDVILPVLTDLMRQHSQLKVDARFSDDVIDIVKEGLDAAVRIGPLEDSRLVGRIFDQQILGTYASPAYLKERGTPESPEATTKHNCLVFRVPSSGRDRPWQFRTGERAYSLHPESDMRLGDGAALVQAAAAGLGLIQVPQYIAQPEVDRGALVEILSKEKPAPLPISLVYPSHRYIPLRVRVLADALSNRLSVSGFKTR